jgi:hypothetical protein
MAETGPQHHERGSALISALALSLALATLAVLSIHMVLDIVFMERQQRREMQVEAGFDSAFAEAMYVLAHSDLPVRFYQEFSVDTAGGSVSVEAYSPLGRVSLNAAPHRVLSAVLNAAGASDADAVAAAIIDWRDADDLRSNRGAESAEYMRAGLPAPANRAFRHEEELTQVLGMTSDVFACLRNEVTVSSWEEAPDLRIASPWLQQLAEMNVGAESDRVDAIISLGTGDLIGLDMRLAPDWPVERRLSVLVRLTGSQHNPYLIQAWEPVALYTQGCGGQGT